MNQLYHSIYTPINSTAANNRVNFKNGLHIVCQKLIDAIQCIRRYEAFKSGSGGIFWQPVSTVNTPPPL